MIFGIGIDIVKTDRVSRLISLYGNRILGRLLNCSTPKVIKAESVAARWALREAAFKAASPHLSFSQIKIQEGPTSPVLIGQGFKFHGSISHEEGIAVAVVIAFKT